MDRDKKGKEEKKEDKEKNYQSALVEDSEFNPVQKQIGKQSDRYGQERSPLSCLFFFFFSIVVIHPVTPQVSSWLTALIQTIQSFRVNFLQLLTPSPSPFLSHTQTFFFRPSYTEKGDQILRSNAQIFIRNNISRAIILRHSC